jgi:hypothetical protein
MTPFLSILTFYFRNVFVIFFRFHSHNKVIENRQLVNFTENYFIPEVYPVAVSFLEEGQGLISQKNTLSLTQKMKTICFFLDWNYE